MTPENFCYWLQGLLELEPALDKLDYGQTKMIREHLQLVFKKETPTTAKRSVPQMDRKLCGKDIPGVEIFDYGNEYNPIIKPGTLLNDLIKYCPGGSC